MQKLLGRQYKWWYLFVYGVKSNNVYFISDTLWYLGQLLFIFSFIFVYSKVSDRELLHEIILTNLFSSFVAFQVCFPVNDSIASGGNITTYLLQPSNIKLRFLIHTLGVTLKAIILNIILFLLILYIFGFTLKIINFLVISIFVISVGVAIKFFADFIIGSLTFWTKNGYGQINLFLTSYAILNGSLISFQFLPKVFKLNPFAFIAYHPMQIYLGKYSPLETFNVFAGGIAWCIVLYFLAKWVFKAGLKRNEAVGL